MKNIVVGFGTPEHGNASPRMGGQSRQTQRLKSNRGEHLPRVLRRDVAGNP